MWTFRRKAKIISIRRIPFCCVSQVQIDSFNKNDINVKYLMLLFVGDLTILIIYIYIYLYITLSNGFVEYLSRY